MVTLQAGPYNIGQFAAAARVTLRTLRYYDTVGLLSPGQRSPAGYRQYVDADLITLQQILALKFLGFSLAEIRACLRRDPRQAVDILARQKAMLLERRAQINKIVAAIEKAQAIVGQDRCEWKAIVEVIEAIQMEQQPDWAKRYFSDDGLKKLEELSRNAYSEEARRKLAAREWTEADQERASEWWAHVAAESKRLADIGADPEGEEAQALAKLKSDLLHEFTQGDPDIEAGLGRLWQSHNALPEDEQPLKPLIPPEVIPGATDDAARLLDRSTEIYRQRNDAQK